MKSLQKLIKVGQVKRLKSKDTRMGWSGWYIIKLHIMRHNNIEFTRKQRRWLVCQLATK